MGRKLQILPKIFESAAGFRARAQVLLERGHLQFRPIRRRWPLTLTRNGSNNLLSSFADDEDDDDDDHHLDGDDGDGDGYGDDLLTRKSSRNFLHFLEESSIQIPHIFYSLFPSSLTNKKAQRQMSRSYVDSF